MENIVSNWLKTKGMLAATAALELLVDASFNLALYGSAISILIYVAGYHKAIRYPGPLIVAYVLLKYVFGGVI